ncbi:MAG: hypothetical protein KW806_01665 [Candidatus Yanofskybacteria bacterium]|nr:hypothetical protein [Candidatus Yanofskybacteria bacterium]
MSHYYASGFSPGKEERVFELQAELLHRLQAYEPRWPRFKRHWKNFWHGFFNGVIDWSSGR